MRLTFLNVVSLEATEDCITSKRFHPLFLIQLNPTMFRISRNSTNRYQHHQIKSPIKRFCSPSHGRRRPSERMEEKNQFHFRKNFNQRLKMNKLKALGIDFIAIHPGNIAIKARQSAARKKFNLNLSLILLLSHYSSSSRGCSLAGFL